jgi:hypothetical protein
MIRTVDTWKKSVECIFLNEKWWLLGKLALKCLFHKSINMPKISFFQIGFSLNSF